jgi:CRISPR-associated endonuclease/helicase Cas3
MSPSRPYPFQREVGELLLSGNSVILQAPTGAGKTRAALLPFLHGSQKLPATAFPRKCIYSVPMRVLANQFHEEYNKVVQNAGYQRDISVKLQMGDQAQDPRFCSDLIFATIDQSLSGALGVPYSLSPRQANLNAGAFCSSYLVFDEFHLFPSSGEAGIEGALVTTLQLLMRLKETTPFILMTATFSSTMLKRLGELLGARVVSVSREEYEMIATERGEKSARSRTFNVVNAPLIAADILTTHQRRSIAICNQVARAQELYNQLRDATKGQEIEVKLLHSRFTAEDRAKKEEWVRKEFGRKGGVGKSLILVATQVIEVGVDITCENLHTEIAPANSILQRAGRCARYPGEQGTVHIYRVPMRESATNGTGEEATAPRYDYLPYPTAVCEASWQSLSSCNGLVVDFQEEQRIIDEVHTDGDRNLLDAMEAQGSRIWQEITNTLDTSDPAQRRNLIRRIDNIKVLVAAQPEDVGNPFAAEGFGLYRWSVVSLFRRLEQQKAEQPSDSLTAPWLMQVPTVVDREPDDPTSVPQIKWDEVTHQSILEATPIVVVNRDYCAYDEDLGFRLVDPRDATKWVSPPGKFTVGNRVTGSGYNLESYVEHIEDMLRIYERDFKDDYAYIEKRLSEQSLGEQAAIPMAGLTRAIRLAIACHDLGKLDIRWQRFVNAYQNAIGEPLPNVNYMAVHTYWHRNNPVHEAAQKSIARQYKRPHHAGESAWAASHVIAELCGIPALGRAVCTAIARHHSPSVASFDDYSLHAGAEDALRQALTAAGLTATKKLVMEQKIGHPLEQLLIRPDFGQQVLYLLVVRMLRICDGLSQEE